jgi:protein-disulfide isomerase
MSELARSAQHAPRRRPSSDSGEGRGISGPSVFLRLLCWLLACALAASCQRPTSAARSAEVDVARSAAPVAPVPAPIVNADSSGVPVESDDAVWGAPTALVTLVAFVDFQCPFCARADTTVEELRRRYAPEELRIVYKHNPLPFHPDAPAAARAAQAVLMLGGPDAFFAYAALLFANQRSLSEENLIGWADEVGLAHDAFMQQFGAIRTRHAVEHDAELAERIGAPGTPAFRINGVTLVGAQPLERFVEVIDHERERARQLVASGVAPSEVYP